jgi:hypothetical protein
MRIDTLSHNNTQTQGARRRAWIQQHAPQHLRSSEETILDALHLRPVSTAQNALILGAGACTEVPLNELARRSDEVILADLDLGAMRLARGELSSSSLQRRVRLLQCDITSESGDNASGVSMQLAKLVNKQPWVQLASQGANALFDAATFCLEQCTVPQPTHLPTVGEGSCGLVVSSLVLTQLFSYPLLDLIDTIQRVAPTLVGEQERHRRYQEAAQAFRIRVIRAHLHLMSRLLDSGGIAVLLSDIRGFAFSVYGTDHDAAHRRAIPLVPRTLPDLLHEAFTIVEEAHWEWLTDLPENERLGRGYEVSGYVLQPL